MLDDALLEKFIFGFYGYGTYNGHYWFVGMEEGGGNSEDEIRGRLHTWHQHGNHELEDIIEFHHAIGIDHHFREHPPIQSTWGKLIRLLLSAENQTVSRAAVRTFQREHWGRANGNNCVVELLPLPSPSLGIWSYPGYSALPYLRTRDIYRDTVIPDRVEHLKRQIHLHQPEVVVFYGMRYRNWWEMITDRKMTLQEGSKIYRTKVGTTTCIMVDHPVAVGVTNKYFEEAGRLVARR